MVQGKADASLVSETEASNQQKEQPSNGQPLQNEQQYKENYQSFRVTVTDQSNEIVQSHESDNAVIPVDRKSNNVDVNTSVLHQFSSSVKEYLQDLLLNRYKKGYDPVLLLARIIFVVLAVLAVIVEMIVFCNIESDLKGLKFLFGSTFLLYEIAAMIYASGAAIYGAVFEAWIFLFLATINSILAHFVWNCDDDSRKKATILWIIKVILLATRIKLTHQNYRQLKSYETAVKRSSRHVLRQTLLFTLTVLVLVAPGLKTVYQSVYLSSSGCSYEVSCGIVELYEPKFYASDPCENGFVAYISTREELRILRNFIYFHIAFYSMFNKPFLDISFNLTYAGLLRNLTLTGFLFSTVSYMWSNIDPFGFVKIPKFSIFDIVETASASLVFVMLIMHCSKWKSNLKKRIKGISCLFRTTIVIQKLLLSQKNLNRWKNIQGFCIVLFDM